MTLVSETPHSGPGSYNDFLAERKLENSPAAVTAYSGELKLFRQQLAAESGQTFEELHFRTVGNTAVDGANASAELATAS